MKKSKFSFNLLIILFILMIFTINTYKKIINNNELEANKITIKCVDELDEQLQFNKVRRGWFDYNKNSFCLDYTIKNKTYKTSHSLKVNYRHPNTKNYITFWKKIYNKLYLNDKDKLTNIYDSLSSIKVEHQLNRTDFAKVIVSFVQDIPYTYLFTGNGCATRENKNDDCLENVYLGILSPVEFMHSLYGDCDTRTVLLYCILKHFNYNPLILISRSYRHSMLALNIQSTGKYILHNGIKYYFWETTGKGWLAGIIPPDMNNILKWDVALD